MHLDNHYTHTLYEKMSERVHFCHTSALQFWHTMISLIFSTLFHQVAPNSITRRLFGPSYLTNFLPKQQRSSKCNCAWLQQNHDFFFFFSKYCIKPYPDKWGGKDMGRSPLFHSHNSDIPFTLFHLKHERIKKQKHPQQDCCQFIWYPHETGHYSALYVVG